MNKVVAVTFNKLMVGGFHILDTLLGYHDLTEVVIFLNGVPEPDGMYEKYKEKFKRNGIEMTLMENDIELDLDKVLRHLVSYAHHNYFEGRLYILRGSDTIKSRNFLDVELSGNCGMLLKGGGSSKSVGVYSVPDYFLLDTPFSFIPVIDLELAIYALQSRDLHGFMECLVSRESKCKAKLIDMRSDVVEDLSDSLVLSGKYSISIIRDTDFKGDIVTSKIIKLLLNKIG